MKSAEFMQLITAIRELDHHQRKLLNAALNQLSDEPKALELIESGFDAKNACPHCASIDLYRHGLVSGLQRYYCKNCHKTFNALTGTPLARLREKPKWLNYLAAMTQSLTARQSASDTGVHRNTSFRWRHRFNWITQDRPSTALPKPMKRFFSIHNVLSSYLAKYHELNKKTEFPRVTFTKPHSAAQLS